MALFFFTDIGPVVNLSSHEEGRSNQNSTAEHILNDKATERSEAVMRFKAGVLGRLYCCSHCAGADALANPTSQATRITLSSHGVLYLCYAFAAVVEGQTRSPTPSHKRLT